MKRRPKIEIFADCLPSRISFGDVDGIVEINGQALMLEWKSDRRSLPTGQQIMYERLSATAPITVFAIIGDAQTMDITDVGVYFRGKWNDFQSSSLQDIKARIRRWVVWAQAVERRVA